MKALILLFLFSLSAQGFDKDFKTANDRLPFDFILMFNSMKLEIKTPADKIKMVALIQDLEKNLGVLDKSHLFLLLKSEMAKGILEHKFTKVRQFDVNEGLIERLEESFVLKSKYLNPFSKYIYRSLIADLALKKTEGILTAKTFNVTHFDGTKKILAIKFQRYLTYMLPWIDKMDSLSPDNFNKLTLTISWEILNRLNDRALLFKRFASTAMSDTQVKLFNIPQRLLNVTPEDIRKSQAEAPLTLQEEGQKEKSQAIEAVEAATPNDMSPVSEDVMKELQEKTE